MRRGLSVGIRVIVVVVVVVIYVDYVVVGSGIGVYTSNVLIDVTVGGDVVGICVSCHGSGVADICGVVVVYMYFPLC